MITGGFNVYHKEMEDEIDAIPEVFESAVIECLIRTSGEGVTAVMVRSDVPSLDDRSILTALERRLAKFKLPKRVVFGDELPRNLMGNLQKALRERFAELSGQTARAS